VPDLFESRGEDSWHLKHLMSVMPSSEQTTAHVDAVGRRLEAAAPADLRELTLTVAAVHEEREPDRLRSAAAAAGAGHDADAVVAIALAFGEVWQVTDEVSLDDYVGRHAGHLRALLLFELAHEGSATEAMTAAAERGGIENEFAGWVAAIR
jgi:hypothetical protein